jgi:hypothetical protein
MSLEECKSKANKNIGKEGLLKTVFRLKIQNWAFCTNLCY